MNELTVVIFDRNGELCGIGTHGAPTRKQVDNCNDRWSFVRGNVRIHCLAVAAGVTEEEARIFAIFMYEGRAVRVNIQEVYDEGIAAL